VFLRACMQTCTFVPLLKHLLMRMYIRTCIRVSGPFFLPF